MVPLGFRGREEREEKDETREEREEGDEEGEEEEREEEETRRTHQDPSAARLAIHTIVLYYLDPSTSFFRQIYQLQLQPELQPQS